MTNVGLNRYLSRVYVSTGISMGLTLAAAYGGTFIMPALTEDIIMTMGVGGFILIGGLLGIADSMKP
jgi:FtsH-binding integral membrane protein